MKKALCILDEYATLHKIDYKIIGNIHDEIQTEVATKDAERFGRLATASIEAAGLHYNSTVLSQESIKLATTGQKLTNEETDNGLQ